MQKTPETIKTGNKVRSETWKKNFPEIVIPEFLREEDAVFLEISRKILKRGKIAHALSDAISHVEF